MNRNTRDRLVLPVLLPLGLLLIILVVTAGFSRILLSEKTAVATTTALLAASSVLGVGIFAATRKRLKPASIFAAIAAVLGLTLFFGGSLLALSGGPQEEGPVEAANGVTVDITAPAGATGTGFKETAITVPVGTPVSIRFDNQDTGVQHNVEVFDGPDAKAAVLMDGDPVITGPAQTTYEMDPLEAGSFFFVCKIHPTTMTGTITADPKATSVTYGAAPSPGPSASPAGPSASPSMEMSPSEAPSAAPSESAEPSGGSTTLSIAAPSGAVASGFDKTELSAPAGTPFKIDFDNQDTGVPHNVEILTADPLKDSSAKSLFNGDQITGPAQITYEVPALEAGTYFYRCIVHPTTMTGTLTVK